MSAREKMELLGLVACTMTVLIIAFCLLPGIIEIMERLGRVKKRVRRRYRAGHRVRQGQARSADHGGPGTDPQEQEKVT